MIILYARAIFLRNCGRFTHISSDFGSQYHTHTFVTSEALYASLTRAATWRHAGKGIDLDEDAKKSTRADYFVCDYDVAEKPVWFTPGLFVDDQGNPLTKQLGVTDQNDFNVISEGHPGTSHPYFVPTYGRIEGILPDHRMLVFAFSTRYPELELFKVSQTFLLGKKRTMFQVLELSEAAKGVWKQGYCETGWLEIPPTFGDRFQSFVILAATMRYLILRGMTRNEVAYLEFDFGNASLSLPKFYLDNTPLGIGSD
jgi:hypothetical protein